MGSVSTTDVSRHSPTPIERCGIGWRTGEVVSAEGDSVIAIVHHYSRVNGSG